MMRVTDYISEYIYKQGINHVFMVSGGGMMFLSDGIASHPYLQAICTHHEQAAAMAAVSYAKYNQKLGVCLVTTGCGSTNAITGLLNGWQDSVPCLFISGQSKRKETIRNSGLNLRQFGNQEADIVSIVQSITKYAVMVNNPELIAYHLDKALYLAQHGRPGPVWIDVPLDVQGTIIDENNLPRFYPEELTVNDCLPPSNMISDVARMIEKAERPITIAGQGIRLGKAIPGFKSFVEKAQIPFVASKLGVDLLPSDHPFMIGRIGNKGDRAGNFALQNSDLVISIGCRLSVSTTGFEYNKFAREAKIVVIDIDAIEHKKNTVRIDLFVHTEAKTFFEQISKLNPISGKTNWINKCRYWKNKYPVCLAQYSDDSQGINLYYFADCLSKAMKNDSTVISDAGSAFYVTTQAIQFKENQRLITSGGQAEMGYTLPATIGVSLANNKTETIGITGDGSFQMNIQELQTIVYHKLPIKLFVWNNDGYLSIRATQRKFFQGRFIGTDSTSGVSFPSIEKIADAYGIKYFHLSHTDNLIENIMRILEYPGPALCEVICIRDQEIIPTVSSLRKDDGTMVSKPLEDMYPFLDREEFNSNMIIPAIDK